LYGKSGNYFGWQRLLMMLGKRKSGK